MARDDGKSAARGARKGARKAGARKMGGRKAGVTARKTGARKATARKATARKAARKGGRKTSGAAARKTARKTTRQARRETTGARKATSATKRTGARKAAGRGARKSGRTGAGTTAAGRRSVLWIETPDQHAERPGQTLATRSHDVIRGWAEERNAVPATVEGTGPGDRLGVLRFEFPYGGKSPGLRPVDWEEWFGTFDTRNLVFLFQEQLRNGRQSNFFQLDNPEREDG